MNNTAHEIMHRVKIVLPLGYKWPADQRDADRERARMIFENNPDLMESRGFASSEELLQKFRDDPHGELPRMPNEI